MKTKFLLGSAATLVLLLAGCQREANIAPPAQVNDGRICFKADGLDMNVSTKTSEITTANLTSFTVVNVSYETVQEWVEDDESEEGGWYEETGEVVDHSWVVTATKSGNVFVTDKYWGVKNGTNLSYKFTCTNLPEDSDYGSAGDGYWCDENGSNYNIPNCDTDWIWATPTYTWGQTVSVTFRHLLSRIGTVAVNGPSGYTLTVNSIKVKAAVRKPHLDLDSDCSTPAEKSLAVGSNNVWFCPGDWSYFDNELANSGAATDPSTGATSPYLNGYFRHAPVLTINYTLTKGDFTKTYEKSQDFTLTQGKTHNLTINITTDEATGIQLNSTVTAWSAQPTTVTIN